MTSIPMVQVPAPNKPLRRFHPFHYPRRTAFTLNELIVIFAITMSLVGWLLPVVQNLRQRAIKTSVEHSLSFLYRLIDDEVRPFNPESFEAFAMLIEAETGLIWNPLSGFLEHPSYDYCFRLILPTTGEKFRIEAFPCDDAEDGVFVLEIAYDSEILDEIITEKEPDPMALAAQQARQNASNDFVLKSIARLFVLSGEQGIETARNLKTTLREPATTVFAFNLLDSNEDQKVSTDELQNFVQPHDGDDPLMAFARSTVAESVEILAVDNGPSIEITLDDLVGDPAEIVSAENLARFVDQRVTHPGIANSLAKKIYRAEERELAGDPDGCAGIIAAFKNQVRAQSGKSIDEENAQLMLSLINVMCPARDD